MSKVTELRKWFTDLTEELEANGFCTRRECMCDMAEPVVKMDALITEMERDEKINPQERTQGSTEGATARS
jgi:hypothetical protein